MAATISRREITEESILHFTKYKTHSDLLGGTKEFLDPSPLNNFVIPDSPNDFYHEVTELDKDRLDSISDEYYGHVEFWWIIAVVNNIFDPVSDLQPGDIIRIPHITSVHNAIRKYRVLEEEDEE